MTNANVIKNYAMQVKPLSKEDGGGFEALFPQIARGVVGYGATAQEAVNDLLEAVPVFLAAIEDMGQTLPVPEGVKEWDEFSGKFNVRVAKVLHAQLHHLAEQQGVSLNSLVQTLLMSGATALIAGHEFGAVIEALSNSADSTSAPTIHWKEKQTVAPTSPAPIFAQDYTRVPVRERNPVITLEETVVAQLWQLPLDKQQEVRDFVESLQVRVQQKQPKKSVKGIGRHLVDKPITAQEIQEARREMWGEYMGEEDAA